MRIYEMNNAINCIKILCKIRGERKGEDLHQRGLLILYMCKSTSNLPQPVTIHCSNDEVNALLISLIVDLSSL